jgi:hypothetical protein
MMMEYSAVAANKWQQENNMFVCCRPRHFWVLDFINAFGAHSFIKKMFICNHTIVLILSMNTGKEWLTNHGQYEFPRHFTYNLMWTFCSAIPVTLNNITRVT